MTQDRLQKTLDRIRTKIEQRADTVVYQLPVWPAPVRGTPNSFLRSALFPAIQGKNRKALKRQILASHRNITIRFTGWQFTQSDLDVWEQAAHLARTHPLGHHCDFTAHAFLKELGRGTSGREHEWLKDVFSRLQAASVEITHDGHTYAGSLIDEFYRDERSGHYKLVLNQKILRLFEAGYTQIPWETRRKLGRKELALWLCAYYSSHKCPHPLKVDSLRKLSGSTDVLKKFRAALKRALDALVGVGVLEAWIIEDDKVHVRRAGESNTLPKR